MDRCPNCSSTDISGQAVNSFYIWTCLHCGHWESDREYPSDIDWVAVAIGVVIISVVAYLFAP